MTPEQPRRDSVGSADPRGSTDTAEDADAQPVGGGFFGDPRELACPSNGHASRCFAAECPPGGAASPDVAFVLSLPSGALRSSGG